MRRMGMISAVALLLSVAVCIVSLAGVNRFVNEARHMRTQAIGHMEADEVQAAEEKMVQLASLLEKWQGFLEVFCEHEDLHEIKEHIIDAQASIEFGSSEDFYQAIFRFGEMLEHISDMESVRIANFF